MSLLVYSRNPHAHASPATVLFVSEAIDRQARHTQKMVSTTGRQCFLESTVIQTYSLDLTWYSYSGRRVSAVPQHWVSLHVCNRIHTRTIHEGALRIVYEILNLAGAYSYSDFDFAYRIKRI